MAAVFKLNGALVGRGAGAGGVGLAICAAYY